MDGPPAPAYTEVPADVYGVIFANISGFRVIAALTCVCRAARAAADGATARRFGGRRLVPLQAHIRDRVLEMPNAEPGEPPNVFEVQAYMGFGKTLLALAVTLADSPANRDWAGAPHRYVVVVPPKAYDTWVKEYCAAFATAAGRLGPDTRVIFGDSSVPPHAARVRAAAEVHRSAGARRLQADIQAALGPAVSVLVLSAVSKTAWGFAAAWATRLVFDEAATDAIRAAKKARPLRAVVRWHLCLSADPLGADGVWGCARVLPAEAEGLVPEAALHWEWVEPAAPTATLGFFDEARNFAMPGHKTDLVRENLGEYRGALARIFAGIPGGQVVVYLPDGAAGELLADAAAELLGAAGWAITRFLKSTTRIREFEGEARGVLLVGLDKSEAINIVGSHLLIFRPDWVNIARYRQVIGRLTRQQNWRRSIPVHVVAPRGLPALRLAHYEAARRLAGHGLEGATEGGLYPAGRYAHADRVLRVLGSAMGAAAPVEIIAALGADDLWDAAATAAAARALHGEWAAGPRRTLTDAQVRGLLGLPDAGAPDTGDAWLDSLLEDLTG